ncbi:383_t:CDS:2 [Dentiscutata erythropus]|uniref:383_t:CDS:1 n=1 Tax=Dentiscutata erythropus TaxID=1348616 RepID=A0A9N9F7U7_9GLOM|nr:383_t:CDS:2 [Dentiscutata erythropus]
MSSQLSQSVKDEGLKTRKIRMYPNLREKETLLKWIGTYQWTYNKCLNLIKDGAPIDRGILSKRVKDIPNAIRSRAIGELYKSQTITIEKRDFIKEKGNYAFLKHIKISEELPEINNAVRITRDRLGRFYFCVCMLIKEYYHEDNGFVSIDPGVRTFMTGYDPGEKIIEYGKGDVVHVEEKDIEDTRQDQEYCEGLPSQDYKRLFPTTFDSQDMRVSWSFVGTL